MPCYSVYLSSTKLLLYIHVKRSEQLLWRIRNNTYSICEGNPVPGLIIDLSGLLSEDILHQSSARICITLSDSFRHFKASGMNIVIGLHFSETPIHQVDTTDHA